MISSVTCQRLVFLYFCCIILYLFYHYCYHYVVNKDFHYRRYANFSFAFLVGKDYCVASLCMVLCIGRNAEEINKIILYCNCICWSCCLIRHILVPHFQRPFKVELTINYGPGNYSFRLLMDDDTVLIT